MFTFRDAVKALEKRRLKEQAGTLPLVEVSAKQELMFYGVTAFSVFIYVLFVITMYWSASDIHKSAVKRFHENPTRFEDPGSSPIGLFYLILISAVFIFFFVTWLGMGYAFADEAAKERIAMREKKAAAKAASDAAKAQQVAVAADEAAKQQRAMMQFRFQALKMMETGVLNLVDKLQDRREWAPEQTSMEAIYEMVRAGLRHSQAPELGILRRTFNPEVLMVLGDQKWLPPEPNDQELMHRNLQTVEQLFRLRS